MNHWNLRLAFLFCLPAHFACPTEDAEMSDENATEAVLEPETAAAGPIGSEPFALRTTRVVHIRDAGVLVFEQQVSGLAGSEAPIAAGQLNGAPVWGYVFPTTLAPSDVGFAPKHSVPGMIVALAVTSHPDFDDTPIWDENGNRNPSDDGIVYHTHWVVLVPDDASPGGLSVRSIEDGDLSVLPSTHPGMPMYLDSPGFSITFQGDRLKVVVPVDRVGNNTEFAFDGVTARMQVDGSGTVPVLRVMEVLSVQSGDLSLPYAVDEHTAGL